MAELTGFEGIYNWSYAGGSFVVELRPFGSFYCKSYPATASWTLKDKVITVEWKKYGKYEMEIKDPSTKLLEGSLTGNPSNWRKAEFVRPFAAAELRLVSGGSVWSFEYDQGSFEIQFHADGFNHFVCNNYPAHAHWALDGDRLTINWGSYGDFEMKLDPTGTTMAGHKAGQPENWRRATFIRSLGPEGLALLDLEHDHCGCFSLRKVVQIFLVVEMTFDCVMTWRVAGILLDSLSRKTAGLSLGLPFPWPTFVFLLFTYIVDFAFAIYAWNCIRVKDWKGIRAFFIYSITTTSIWAFHYLCGLKSSMDILIWFFITALAFYFEICVWTLYVDLSVGGVAAQKVGFDTDQELQRINIQEQV